MRNRIALLLMLAPFIAHTQNRPETDAQISRVIDDLQASWTLGVDSNSNTVDIAMYNKYKSLFEINARVGDDLNFRFAPGKDSGGYKLVVATKDFDVYAHDAALQVSKFRVDSVSVPRRMNIQDSMIYEISRTIYVEKQARYVVQDIDVLAASILSNHPDIRFEKKGTKAIASYKDEILEKLKEKLRRNPDSIYKFSASSTLHVALAYTSDTNNPVKIIGIQQVAPTLRCMNDNDGDGVLNRADNLPDKYGEFTADGAPDDDLDGAPDAADRCRGTYGSIQNRGCPESYFFSNKELEGSIGLRFNAATIRLPELNQLGYRDESGADAMDVLQSKKGSLNNPVPILGINAGGSFAYFFGKNARHAGISLGFSYSRFVANYGLGNTIVYTYKSFDGADYYRRQITIGSLVEKIAYNVISIPVQLNYRFKLNVLKNWVINLKAGPSFTLITGSSDYNATIDIGGIYQVDSAKNKITYYDHFDASSTWNVYMTTAGINRQNSGHNASAIFADVKNYGNYDFVSDSNFHDQKKISRVMVAFNFSLEGRYKRNKDSPMAIKAGIHFMYAPFAGSKEPYKPIDRTSDPYNSIFNSNGKTVYFAYGVDLGLVYDF